MEQKETKVDNVRVVLHGDQLAAIQAALNEIHALRLDNKALTERIDRLYSHLGLRG